MSASRGQVRELLARLDAAWAEFTASYDGLSDAQLMERGVAGEWSMKDILAHVTTWEEEALTHLPLILEGGRPPRYATVYGGIDAFNALMAERRRELSLADVRRQLHETHHHLIVFIESAPAGTFAGDTRARRRLRLDTYSHYPIHTRMIQEWRKAQEMRSSR